MKRTRAQRRDDDDAASSSSSSPPPPPPKWDVPVLRRQQRKWTLTARPSRPWRFPTLAEIATAEVVRRHMMLEAATRVPVPVVEAMARTAGRLGLSAEVYVLLWEWPASSIVLGSLIGSPDDRTYSPVEVVDGVPPKEVAFAILQFLQAGARLKPSAAHLHYVDLTGPLLDMTVEVIAATFRVVANARRSASAAPLTVRADLLVTSNTAARAVTGLLAEFGHPARGARLVVAGLYFESVLDRDVEAVLDAVAQQGPWNDQPPLRALGLTLLDVGARFWDALLAFLGRGRSGGHRITELRVESVVHRRTQPRWADAVAAMEALTSFSFSGVAPVSTDASGAWAVDLVHALARAPRLESVQLVGLPAAADAASLDAVVACAHRALPEADSLSPRPLRALTVSRLSPVVARLAAAPASGLVSLALHACGLGASTSMADLRSLLQHLPVLRQLDLADNPLFVPLADAAGGERARSFLDALDGGLDRQRRPRLEALGLAGVAVTPSILETILRHWLARVDVCPPTETLVVTAATLLADDGEGSLFTSHGVLLERLRARCMPPGCPHFVLVLRD